MKAETIIVALLAFFYAIMAGCGYADGKSHWGIWLIASVFCIIGVAWAGHRRL